MSNLSQRASELQASPIRKLMPHAIAAKQRGVHVHHLNIGQPDIPTPQVVLDALHQYPAKTLAYAQSGGAPDYVTSLHRYYASLGHDLAPGAITVTTGGSEAILFAFIAALNPGDEILLPEPYYTNYGTMAEMAGLKIVPITTSGDKGFHLPDMAAIEAKVTSRTRAFLLCNPSNPTGTVYTRAELDVIRALVKKHNMWLICDEVYREFVFDPRDGDYISVLEMDDITDNVIVVDSISKRFSMCGARLGALVTRNRDLSEAVLKLGQARLSSSSLAQHIATQAHTLPQSYFDGMIDEYRRRRDVVYRALSEMPGVSLVKPEGAFYAIPTLPVEDAEHFATWLLTDFSRDNETLMVAPAAGFYASPGLGRNQVRIAFVLEEALLERAMAILREALEFYIGQRVALSIERDL